MTNSENSFYINIYALIEWIVTHQTKGKHKSNWLGCFNKVSKSTAWICFPTLGKYSLITVGTEEEGSSNKVDFIEALEKMKPCYDS